MFVTGNWLLHDEVLSEVFLFLRTQIYVGFERHMFPYLGEGGVAVVPLA